jgi:hypothetical protein
MAISSELVQTEVIAFCEQTSRSLDGLSDYRSCIDLVRTQLPKLLLNKELCIGLLTNIIQGGGYPDIRRTTLFDNEVPLYLDPQGRCSLRMYLWGPGEYTDPHDHNSWGVIGTVSEGYEVINYRRLDDESRSGYARLEEVERLRLQPGETAHTLPFSKGIHRTGNASGDCIVTFHLYGKTLPRGFLNCFDPANNRVYRLYPPRRKKELLARQALYRLEKD